MVDVVRTKIINCATQEERYEERILSSEEITAMEVETKQIEAEYWINIDYKKAVNSKIRERYDESEEFAILRQKDEKPDEYKAYFDYCEECKAFIKAKKAEYGGGV